MLSNSNIRMIMFMYSKYIEIADADADQLNFELTNLNHNPSRHSISFLIRIKLVSYKSRREKRGSRSAHFGEIAVVKLEYQRKKWESWMKK